jgi:hypothetical protein
LPPVREALASGVLLVRSLEILVVDERVQEANARAVKIRRIARDNREAVEEGDGSNLPVDRMLWPLRHEPSPHLGGLMIKIQHPVAVRADNDVQPLLKALCLVQIAAQTDGLHTLAQLTQRLNRQEEGVRVSRPQKAHHAWVRPLTLAQFADDIGIDQVHRVRLRPVRRKVVVGTDVRHAEQDFSEGQALRSMQRLLEDFPMFCLCASPMKRRALF